MCIGFEGVLVEAEGSGVVRIGLLRVGAREYRIGLACVPEAQVGDRIIAHSGQAVRVVAVAAQQTGGRSQQS